MLSDYEMMSSDTSCDEAMALKTTSSVVSTDRKLQVGDEVCITGFIMDHFCIERGTLLDNPSIVTLENPEEHSFHCLLDVQVCYESGFQVLGEKNAESGLHELGYRLDDSEAVIAAGRASGQDGYCSTCTGDSSAPDYGYQATVRGIVSELGDGSDGLSGTPLLTNIELTSADNECETLNASETTSTPESTAAPTSTSEGEELKIGDSVCITSYIIDNFCIERGTFLDNDSLNTLENPEEHSFHCLLDVDLCKESGYQVIGDKNPDTGMHCLGFRLDDTDAVVAAGQAVGQQGYCTSCTGDSSAAEYGWLATVRGTVSELGDGSTGVTGTPLLTDIEILSSDEACETVTVSPLCLAAPNPAPTPSGPGDISSAITGDAVDCSSDFCENQLAENFLLRYRINVPEGSDPVACEECTITMQAIYDGVAWVSIAFSTDGSMIGSEAVIGVPEEVPLKYNLDSKSNSGVTPMPDEQQTLVDAVVNVSNGQTTLEFTKIMSEPNEIEITTGDNNFLWAYGSSETLGYHASRAAFVQNLSTGAAAVSEAPNKSAWLAHGIMAFIAWGALSPWAVEASLFRKYFGAPTWFNLHRVFNGAGYALTVAAFAVAVAYYNKEGNIHFNNSHARMGLSMFVLASLQVLAGMLRPHVPGPGEEKSSVRQAWEMGHRVTGLVLLGCGFWQMREGISLFAQKYSVTAENEDKLAIVYWVWIALMSALILLGLASKLANSGEENVTSPQAAANAEVSVREGEGRTELSRLSTEDA